MLPTVPKTVAFTMKDNPATVVELTTLDGKHYLLEMRVALAQIWEPDGLELLALPAAPTGSPTPQRAFGFQATIVTSIKAVEP